MQRTRLPAAPLPKTGCTAPRPSRSTRWRALVLVLFHLAAGAHIYHWWSRGRSISPVEPSEAHEFFTYGVINAGFVLLALSMLATLVLGRWFCGWACHLVALQDLCAGLLARVGLRPRPVRARLLAFVPLYAAVDVFLLPRILRWWSGQEFPELRAQFTTDALWETFPGPWMAGLTLAVDGFLLVYLFGAKGFCTYGCPYGALFGLAERAAPARIRVTDACEGCGHCTATCTSNVDVRQEVARFGMVVDTGCMKCLDCVSVCPKDALYFGFAPRSQAEPSKAREKGRTRRTFDFSWPEELFLAAVFVFGLHAYRGLYGAVPFLLALGLALLTALGALLLLRLVMQRDLVFQDRVLKSAGRLKAAGRAAAALLVVALAFALHSGYVQYHARLGTYHLKRANEIASTPARGSPAYREAMLKSQAHLDLVERHGLFTGAELHNKLGSLALGLGDERQAEEHLRRAIALDDSYVNTRVRLAELLIVEQRHAEALEVLRATLERDPDHALAGLRLASLVASAPDLLSARLLLVEFLIRRGDLEDAERGLAPLLTSEPRDPAVEACVQALERARAAAQ